MSAKTQFVRSHPPLVAKMPKYAVQLTAMIDVTTEIVLEADDPEQARYLAFRKAQNEKLTWDRMETSPRLLDIIQINRVE